MTGEDRVAAIDVGTNSTRLLVVDRHGAGGKADVVERLMRITRLGHKVDSTGMLDSEAIGRTLEVLGEYREIIDRLGVTRLRMTATSAARDAKNRSAFFEPAEEIMGSAPELISGTEEGALSFRGATSDLDPGLGPFLVVDIGGGSTELICGTSEVGGVVSCDIGCVRLTEKYLHHDPPLAEELTACLSAVQDRLADVKRALPGASAARTLVGLAGTITTVAAVEMGLAHYDRDRVHHFILTKAAAEDVFRTIATERFEDRVHNPGLARERADVIVGGTCILVEIMRDFGFEECLVSEADILDGLAASIPRA